MKVALTHPYSWPEVRRGAERIIMETARALSERGHDVTIFTAGWDTDDSLTGDQHSHRYRIVRFRRRYPDPQEHERWFGRRLLKPLATGQFHVTHSLMPHDALAAVWTRPLGHHRVVYEEMGNPLRSWWATLPDRRVRERLVKAVDVYGCMSRYSLDILRGEWDREGALIPGGVRLSEFRPAPTRATQPIVLFSGAVDQERKGVPLLLEAMVELAQLEPDVELWLSGPGDAAPLLARAHPDARARTRVLGLGEAGEQHTRYGQAWVTALPSRGDSFGMALLESLACGTPIVVANDGAPPELVTAETGVVSSLDAESLVGALAKGLGLARDEHTAGACRSAAARFDWDTAMAPRLERLYQGDARATEPDRADDSAAARVETVERVLADPPTVHRMAASDDRPAGVWSTERDCYQFMAERCRPGSHTLETGAGISTILFAAWGAVHRCVTPLEEQEAAVRSYCDQHGIRTDRLSFEIAPSEDALPRLDPSVQRLDLVLIDGGHGFPAPIIDWYYGAGRLRHGGILVIDDVQLPAVQTLLTFLDLDPRWQAIRRTNKWVAYRRNSEGPMTENWFLQSFYEPPRPGWRHDAIQVKRKARSVLSELKRSLTRISR